jgi:hypothetical protein
VCICLRFHHLYYFAAVAKHFSRLLSKFLSHKLFSSAAMPTKMSIHTAPYPLVKKLPALNVTPAAYKGTAAPENRHVVIENHAMAISPFIS